MYTVKQTIYSHGTGKTYPAGSEVTERDFPPHSLAILLASGTIEATGQPSPETENSAESSDNEGLETVQESESQPKRKGRGK